MHNLVVIFITEKILASFIENLFCFPFNPNISILKTILQHNHLYWLKSLINLKFTHLFLKPAIIFYWSFYIRFFIQ